MYNQEKNIYKACPRKALLTRPRVKDASLAGKRFNRAFAGDTVMIRMTAHAIVLHMIVLQPSWLDQLQGCSPAPQPRYAESFTHAHAQDHHIC